MNKKLKKIIATVSAVAMCATSAISLSAGAVCYSLNERVTPYTTSFSTKNFDGSEGVKFHLWQEATDYYNDEKIKVYISEPMEYQWHGEEELKSLVGTKTYEVLVSSHYVWKEGDPSNWYDFCDVCILDYGYYYLNEDDAKILEKYLSDNNIKYESELHFDDTKCIQIHFFDSGITDEYEKMQKLIDIKEDTGFVTTYGILESEISIGSVENTLPEPTLTGDSNEDGEVSIADAILIMQSLVNPDEYSLTPQGIANADINGDGITTLDALLIQEMLVKK